MQLCSTSLKVELINDQSTNPTMLLEQEVKLRA
jgi:hypothetical protein